MKKISFFHILSSLLIVFSLSVFWYKTSVLHFPLTPDSETLAWNIEAEVTFDAHDSASSVELQIPQSDYLFDISNEHFVARGFGYVVTEKERGRTVRFTKRRADGKQVLYYSAVIRPKNEQYTVPDSPPPLLTENSFTEAQLTAAENLISYIGEKSFDSESFISLLVEEIKHPQNPNAKYLAEGLKSNLPKVNLTVKLLALAGIASDAMHGVPLYEGRNVSLMHWIEVYVDNKWITFDFNNGTFAVPERFLTLWRGSEAMAKASGIENLRVNISVQQRIESQLESSFSIVEKTSPAITAFSLFSLPVETQELFKTILLIPLGALLLVILRNVVGVSTFGTFMPILIALSFVETKLLAGVILFSTIVGIGMIFRLLFEKLHLLLVPRLAAILIIVVLIMAILSVVSYRLGFNYGLSVAMFPMIILTMTIERMAIVWDENGAAAAIKQGLGSLSIAVLAYLIFVSKYIEFILFVYPEVQLIFLAFTLLVGRYTGYRLMDLYRFKAFAEEK